MNKLAMIQFAPSVNSHTNEHVFQNKKTYEGLKLAASVAYNKHE